MTTSTSEDLKTRIRNKAAAIGFDAVGFARADRPWPAAARLHEFIARERHGAMEWMAATADRRQHPQSMWPDAKSAIVLGTNYGPEHDPLAILGERDRAAVSVYAQNEDYHDLIKKRLKALARDLAAETGCELKVFVDTAPLMEKPLAHAAGVGWQGKHTNLVSRQFGSWLFLGSILTTLDIEPDAPSDEHCGACSACLDICPTQAFPAPFQLDARRCISYLTIEHAGPIPREFRAALGNRIYGCDDCLAVCPWNKFAQTARDSAFHAREALKAPALADLARLDDPSFRALFTKSPVKRIGRARFIRNVLYAIGNSGDAGLMRVVEPLLADDAPEVRGAAAWAASRLLDAQAFAALAGRLAMTEPDEGVRAELYTSPFTGEGDHAEHGGGG